MTKLRFITLLTVLLTGYTNAQNVLHVEKDLRYIVNQAMLEFKKIGHPIEAEKQPFVVMFGNTRSKAAGVSHGKDKEGVLIFINKEVWIDYDIRSKVWVMVHELAHDIYNLEHHHDGLMQTNVPVHITTKVWADGMQHLKEQIENQHNHE